MSFLIVPAVKSLSAGQVYTQKTDPQAIWDTPKRLSYGTGRRYISRDSSGGGRWIKAKVPEGWKIGYRI